MNGGSLGMRSGSHSSLQQQQHSSSLPGTLPTLSSRKPGKMLKEKEKLVQWIFKFAGKNKIGMLVLCLISTAVFLLVLCVGKGEDSEEVVQIIKINNDTSEPDTTTSLYSTGILGINPLLPLPPPPPSTFVGYTLPRGHPCNTFSLPPPPADKKRTGPRPCPVCYLPVEEAIALMPKSPSDSPVLKNLTFIYEENLNRETEFGGSDFGGYPTLKQRNDSYDIRESMNIHCGFTKGSEPGLGTGYDMDEIDRLAMKNCHGVVVSSAIFGNFDEIQQPKNISEYSKKTVCFFMFVDEETEAYLKNTSAMDSARRSGIWRVIVVRNLPYTDARRTGKIPKLLIHRMFPNARFSLWIDGKLELVVDPYQILERFLWRKNATFAISRHYKRFDTFTEAEANKAAGKYDNASIDFQIEFYRNEGLTPYSEAKLPITSDVPEGCVIVREHVPISNLFACLWFHEVDRFTSRDQISFSTVRDKIRAKTNWTINMFLDCERRNFVVQKYHRDVLEQKAISAPVLPPPPPPMLPPPPPLATDPPVEPETEPQDNSITETPIVQSVPVGRMIPGRNRKVISGNTDTDSG